MKRIICNTSNSNSFKVELVKQDGHVTLWRRFSSRVQATEFIYKLRTQSRYWEYRRDKCRVVMIDLAHDEIVKEVQLSLDK